MPFLILSLGLVLCMKVNNSRRQVYRVQHRRRRRRLWPVKNIKRPGGGTHIIKYDDVGDGVASLKTNCISKKYSEQFQGGGIKCDLARLSCVSLSIHLFMSFSLNKFTMRYACVYRFIIYFPSIAIYLSSTSWYNNFPLPSVNLLLYQRSLQSHSLRLQRIGAN